MSGYKIGGFNDSTVVNDDSPEARHKGRLAQQLPFNGQDTLTIKNQDSNWSKDMSPQPFVPDEKAKLQLHQIRSSSPTMHIQNKDSSQNLSNVLNKAGSQIENAGIY